VTAFEEHAHGQVLLVLADDDGVAVHRVYVKVVLHRVYLSWVVVGETNHTPLQENFTGFCKNKFLVTLKTSVIVWPMKKDDTYYLHVYDFAHKQAGSYAKLAKALGDVSGPAVQAWANNGVAHKWRPVLDKKFGPAFRKSLSDLIV